MTATIDLVEVRAARLYFVQAGDERGPIKIGISADPTKRLEQLRTGNHLPLRLLDSFATPHPEKLERGLHDAFADLRLEGEWFRFDVRIVRVLELLRAKHAMPDALRSSMVACDARVLDGTEASSYYVVEWSDRQGCIHIDTLGDVLAMAREILVFGRGSPGDYVILAITPSSDEARRIASVWEPWLLARRVLRTAGYEVPR